MLKTSATPAQDVQTPASCANRTGGVADYLGVDSMSVSAPTPESATPAHVTDSLFGECLFTLTRRADDSRAGDHLRSTVRIAREMWNTEPGGPAQRRALRLVLEAFIIETAVR